MRQQTATNEHPLVRAMQLAAERRGLRTIDIAQLIGVSRPYYMSLCNGHKPFSGLSIPTLRHIATLIGCSFVDVAIMAGVIVTSDIEKQEGLEEVLDEVYDHMRLSKAQSRFMVYSREEWRALPMAVRLQITHLYQEHVGKVFLERAKTAQEFDELALEAAPHNLKAEQFQQQMQKKQQKKTA